MCDPVTAATVTSLTADAAVNAAAVAAGSAAMSATSVFASTAAATATLGTLSTAASLASTGLGVASSMRNAAYQSGVAKNNAKRSKMNAEVERAKGDIEVQKQRETTAQLIGSQRAGYGASGISLSGTPSSPDTPTRIQMDTAGLGSMDAKIIRNNAARGVFGYEQAGADYLSQADESKTKGWLDSMGSIVGGASAIADSKRRSLGYSA